MWQKTYSETVTGTTAAALWNAQSDVNSWPRWHNDLESTELKGAPRTGAEFTLKPKGGPLTHLTILHSEPGSRFTDKAHLPGCKMIFDHRFTETAEGVRIDLDLRMHGPMTFLWKRVIGRKQAEEFAAHVRELVHEARSRTQA